MVVFELLDPDQRYKLFTVVGKVAKEPLAPVTEEEGASDHRIKGETNVSWGAGQRRLSSWD